MKSVRPDSQKLLRKPFLLTTGIRALVPSLTLLAAGLLSSSSAGAATGTWNIDANTTGWGTATNWSGNIIPNGIDDIANFTFDLSAARTINLDGPRTLGSMTVGDPTTSFFGYTFSANTQGGALVFDTSAGNASLTFTAASTAASTFNVPIVLNDPLNIHALNAAANTFNGNITGTGGLIIDAGGTHGSGSTSTTGQLVFSGVNTFSGGISITEARTQFTSSFSLGTGAVTINDGGQAYLVNAATYYNNFTLNTLGWNETGQGQLGALRSDGASTLAGTITLAGDSRLVGTGNTTLINNAIGETGGSHNLEINRLFSGGAAAAATWVFKGSNTYTGKTTVNSGTLRIGDGGATGSLGATSSLEFANATIEFRRSDNVTVTTPFTQLTGTIGGVAVTGSNFVHSGTGVLTIDNGSSGYLGSTTVNGLNAKLTFGSGGAYVFAGQGNIALSNGADLEFKTSSDIQIGGGANPATQAMSGATNSYLIQSGTGTITLGGTSDNSSGRAIVNSGTLVLNKATTSASHAIGASNELGLILNAGTVRYGVDAHTDEIYTQTDVQVNGGTFDLNGKMDGFDLLTGTGGIVTNSAASTNSNLTLGENNSTVNPLSLVSYNTTFGGSIQDGAGTMSLTKSGTGIQVLTGANTFTGGTTLSAGTLVVNGSLAATGAVSLNGTSTLAGTGSVGDVALIAGTSLRPGATAFDTASGTLTMNSLVVTGGDIRMNLGTTNDVIVVTNAATFAGPATITPTFASLPTAGTITLINAAGGVSSFTNPTLTIPATTRSAFLLNITANTVDLVISGPSAKALTWTGAASGAWDLNTTANFNSGSTETYFNLDSVTFGDGPTNRTVTLATGLQPTAVTVSNSAGNDYTFQTGTLAGGMSLTKTGAGVLNVNTANTFGGNVTITGGTLKAGNAAALGDAGGQTFVSGGGTLDVNALNLGAEVVNISGNGVGGNGALINSSATAQTQALRFVNLTGDATVGGVGRMDVRANGGGELVDLAGHTLTKTGANLFYVVGAKLTDGPINVVQGEFGLASALALGTSPITLSAGTNLRLSTTSTVNVNRPLILNGAASIDADNSTSAIASNVTLGGDLTFMQVVSGGTLTINGAISQTGGARSVSKVNAGTVVLAGNNTFTGGLSVSGGSTFTLSGTNTVAGPVSVTGGSTLQVLGNVNTNATLGTPSSIALDGSTLRLNMLSNSTLPAVTMGTTSASTLVFSGQTQASTLTVNSTVGSTTALNTLSIEQGTVTLASGANVTVGASNVGTLSQGASGNLGTLNVQAGASLTAGNMYIGEGASGRTGIVNQTGGTVSVTGTDVGNDGIVRIGHWAGTGSAYNLSAGTLNVPNGTTSIGVDGIDASFNMTGGTANLYRLLVDGRSATAPIGGTLNLSGGELSIGAGGLGSFGGSQFNFTGGTLSASASSTWTAPMDLEGTAPVINTKGNNVTYSGAVIGSGSFTKTGNGALTLSGTSVANTGAINISGGLLVVTGQTTAASAVNVNSGGTLGGNGNGTTTGRVTNVTLNAGGFLRPGGDSFDSSIGNLATTTLNFNGGTLQATLNPTTFTTGAGVNDVVTVNGALTLNGGSVVPVWTAAPSAGTYTLITSTGLTLNTLPVLSPAAVSRQTYILGTSGNNLTLTVSGSAANLTWNGSAGNSNWDLNSSTNWKLALPNDEKFMAYDTVNFNDVDATPGTVNLVGTLLPGGVNVDTSSTYTFSGPGSIGAGSLSKFGTGTLVIANDNTMPGAITVSAGTLQFGTGGTAGSLDGGAGSIANVNLTDNGTIDYNRSNYALYSKVISGTGTLIKDGSGTLALGAQNTYTGNTTVNAGILELAGGGGTNGVIRGIVTVNPGATLRLSTADAVGFGTGGVQITTLNLNSATLNFNTTANQTFSNMAVNLTGSSITGIAGSTFDLFNNGSVINSLASATTSTIGTTTFNLRQNDTQFNVDDGAASPDLLITSNIGNGSGGNHNFIKNGAGSLVQTGTITATGSITSNAGNLTLSGTLNNAPAGIVINGGVVEATTANAFGGNSAAGATGVNLASRPAQKTASAATTTTTVTVAATADLAVGMTVSGTGIAAGSRVASITNATTFELTAAANVASAAALNFGPAPMIVNGGTFRYSGAAATDDRFINVSNTGGTIEASGTGALTLTSALQFNGQIGSRTLTLGGTSTAANTFSGVIADNTGATRIVKSGSGAWTLSGTNTYTGTTTVSTGELRITNASAVGTGAITLGDASTSSSSVALYLDTNRTTFVTSTIVSSAGTGLAILGSRSTVGGSGANNSFQNITLQRDVTFDSNAADRTDYKTISGLGNITIIGTGRSIFSTANTFFGDLTIAPTGAGFFQSGVATAGNQNFIPDTSNVTVVAGSHWAVSSGGESINALLGGGLVNVNSINAILTVGAAGGSGDFSGVMANATQTLGLTKIGAGVQTLSGLNTYTGLTTVTNGTLLVTGSISGSATTINGATATLAGTGTTGPITMTAGTLTVGNNSIGTLATGALALNGGTASFDLGSSTSDRLNVVGAIAFGAPVALNLNFNSDLATGTAYTLISNDGSDPFSFAGGGGFTVAGAPVSEGTPFDYTSGAFTETFQLSYAGNDGNDAVLTVLPEPGVSLALLSGLGVLLARRRGRSAA